YRQRFDLEHSCDPTRDHISVHNEVIAEVCDTLGLAGICIPVGTSSRPLDQSRPDHLQSDHLRVANANSPIAAPPAHTAFQPPVDQSTADRVEPTAPPMKKTPTKIAFSRPRASGLIMLIR